MTTKKKINIIKKTKTQKNVSKRAITYEKSVWGKNKSLETFWRELSIGKKVVLIYKNGNHKIVKLKNGTEQLKKQYASFDDDPNITAVLTSPMSQDAYEVHLYPKAKKASVKEVIKNYKKYFKMDGTTPKNLAAQGWRWDKLANPY